MLHFLSVNKRNKHDLIPVKTARSCPTCENYTHRWEDIGDISEPIKQDYSVTQEGFHIVSQKFRDIVEEVCVRDVEFLPLTNGSYVFRPKRSVMLDVRESLERTKGPCLTCGRLTAFLGVPPLSWIMEGQDKVGEIDIVGSIQEFGSDNFFGELLIFGEEIMEALNDEGLSGGIFWYECRQDHWRGKT